jgi:hypothetical protein
MEPIKAGLLTMHRAGLIQNATTYSVDWTADDKIAAIRFLGLQGQQ